jgi:imidazole glycerol phosphate synthase subunit HisF
MAKAYIKSGTDKCFISLTVGGDVRTKDDSKEARRAGRLIPPARPALATGP